MILKSLETPPPPAQTSGRRAKKNVKKVDETPDQVISQPSSSKSSRRKPKREPSEEEEEDRHRVRDDADEDDDGDDGDDPFGSSFLGRGGAASLHSTMRALSGMMGGSSTGSRLREILENLRQKDDPSVQIIALGELAQLLLVSTEDNLSGQIAPDQFVKELVVLMQPNEFGEENSEMMLLACRCIANLMEALPPATASVVYGGAVPILCQKLLEIHYIDLAEQALSVGCSRLSTRVMLIVFRLWKRYLSSFPRPLYERVVLRHASHTLTSSLLVRKERRSPLQRIVAVISRRTRFPL